MAAFGALAATLKKIPPASASRPEGSTLFLVDGSGSIGTSTFYGPAKSCITSMSMAFPVSEELAIIQFSSDTRVECDFTKDRTVFSSKLSAMKYLNESTNTQKGVHDALNLIRPRVEANRRGTIIIITDGQPDSDADPLVLFNTIKMLPHIRAIAIGVGNGIAMPVLQSWTDLAYTFQNFTTLIGALQEDVPSEETTLIIDLKLFPSQKHQNACLPRSEVYLDCKIYNGSPRPIPKGALIHILGGDYFITEVIQLPREVTKTTPLDLEIVLKPACTANETNYPGEIHWDMTIGGHQVLAGCCVLGTEFLARELLPPAPVRPTDPTWWANILIFGLMGSGKSSLVNCFLTAMTSSPTPVTTAMVMQLPTHVTTEYSVVTLDAYQDEMLTGGQRFPLMFWDTWGVNMKASEATYKTMQIDLLLRGLVKNGTQMKAGDSVPDISVPDPERLIHAVAFVMTIASRLDEPIMDALREHIVRAVRLGYSPLVIVTYIDREPDHKHKALKTQIAGIIGVQENRVFFHKNYTEETVRSPKIDLSTRQILLALRDTAKSYQRAKRIGPSPQPTFEMTESLVPRGPSTSGPGPSTSGTSGCIPGLTVRAWLQSIDLGELAPIFEREKVRLSDIKTFSDDDLKALGITAFGDRRRILNNLP